MAKTDWRISGTEIAACNCDWGCPCQFNALPSKGNCTGGLCMKIDSGHFGSTRLDGVTWGMIGSWPAAIHQGNGTLTTFVDSRATPEQQKAIIEIVSGAHSNEGTLFFIFSAVCPTKLPPVIEPIELSMDPAQRTGKVRIGKSLQMDVEPIRNPITGDPHFPRLVLPGGFEFKEADFASSKHFHVKAGGKVDVTNQNGHAHFAKIALGPTGYLG